jgi:hypothetical protein
MHTNDSGFGVRAERTSGRLDDARRASDATRWRAWFAAVAFVQADECGFGTVGSDSQRSISRARSCVHQLVSCSKKARPYYCARTGSNGAADLFMRMHTCKHKFFTRAQSGTAAARLWKQEPLVVVIITTIMKRDTPAQAVHKGRCWALWVQYVSRLRTGAINAIEYGLGHGVDSGGGLHGGLHG